MSGLAFWGPFVLTVLSNVLYLNGKIYCVLYGILWSYLADKIKTYSGGVLNSV